MNAAVLSNAAMWAGIVGFLSPLVIQFITKATSNRQVQAVLAFVFCVVASFGTAAFAPDTQLNAHSVVKSLLIVFTLAMTSYESLWKPTGLTPSNTTPVGKVLQ